jgi:hypothetical protein
MSWDIRGSKWPLRGAQAGGPLVPVGNTNRDQKALMTHKYRGSIVVLSISKSVEPNEEQKEMTSGFQQGILCKHWNYR